MEEYERIGSLPLDVVVEIKHKHFSINRFDDLNGNVWLEMRQTLEITTIFNKDVRIKKTSRLRQTLTTEEVERLKEKGIIQIKLEQLKSKSNDKERLSKTKGKRGSN